MKLVKNIVFTVSLMLSANVFAMSGLEFIKLVNPTSEKQILEPIIIQYVSNGYKNIPDWPKLSAKIRELILKNGYNNQPLERISEEFAKQLGMSR